jgi:hypothetical protein
MMSIFKPLHQLLSIESCPTQKKSLNHRDCATGDGKKDHSWASIASQEISIAGTDALPLKMIT